MWSGSRQSVGEFFCCSGSIGISDVNVEMDCRSVGGVHPRPVIVPRGALFMRGLFVFQSNLY